MEDEVFETPATKYAIIGSLEPCKISFFSKDYIGFLENIQKNCFRIYSGSYLFSSDFDSRPTFVVNNFLNGLVQQFETTRKYFFTAFTYVKNDDKYTITSTWITNCVDDLNVIINDKYDDFVWEILSNEGVSCPYSTLPNEDVSCL